MKKKLITMMLACALVFTVACGQTNESAESENNANATEETNVVESTGDETEKDAKADESEDLEVVKGTVKYDVDMSSYDKGDKVRLWLPVAKTIDEQVIEDVDFDAGAAKAELTTDDLGNDMLYVEWDENTEPTDRKVSLSFHAERKEAEEPEFKEEGEVGDDMDEYLQPSTMVVTDGDTKALAEEITKDKTTELEKARAIYDWVIANLNRDESVIGCGTGDVEKLLVTKEGKCTDINSVFIGLCRSVGIPAREMFGVRMNDEDITKNQHCWSQFYLPGTGWVYADPADVLKAVLKNEWDKDSQETKDLAEYYWGQVDAERVELSRGRDLILNPAQEGEPLNNFGYPYAEVNGEAVDFYSPDSFIYSISFEADE